MPQLFFCDFISRAPDLPAASGAFAVFKRLRQLGETVAVRQQGGTAKAQIKRLVHDLKAPWPEARLTYPACRRYMPPGLYRCRFARS